MVFETARFTLKNQQQGNCQGFTSWFCGKDFLKKKIPRSLHWRSSTFKSLSPLTTKTIQKSHQQHLLPLIRLQQWPNLPLHQWSDPLLHQLLGPRQLKQRNAVDLLGPQTLLSSEQRSPRSLFCLIPSTFPP